MPDTEGDGRSDHAPFKDAGIRVGGAHAGFGARKTAAQQRMWGGTANQPFDGCYHQACDTQVNATAEDRHADAAAHVLWKLSGATTPPVTP